MKANIISLLVLLNVAGLYSQEIKGLEEIPYFPKCEVKLIGTDESLYDILKKNIGSFSVYVNIPVNSLFGKAQLFPNPFSPSSSILWIPSYVFTLEQKSSVIIELLNDDKSFYKLLFREELSKGYYCVKTGEPYDGSAYVDLILLKKLKIQLTIGEQKYLYRLMRW